MPTICQLKDMIRAKKLKGYGKMNKSQLIALLGGDLPPSASQKRKSASAGRKLDRSAQKLLEEMGEPKRPKPPKRPKSAPVVKSAKAVVRQAPRLLGPLAPLKKKALANYEASTIRPMSAPLKPLPAINPTRPFVPQNLSQAQFIAPAQIPVGLPPLKKPPVFRRAAPVSSFFFRNRAMADPSIGVQQF
jgi:hypothetical protein